MKKIGIDARLYFQTGVGVYLRNFLFNLQKIAPADFTFFVYVQNEDNEKIVFKSKKFIKRAVNDKWHSVGEQSRFLGELNKDNLDLMHFTYFGYPVLYLRPFIATIHDLTPLLFKTGRSSTRNPLVYNLKHLAFRFVVKSQVRNAKYIITPTKSIRAQIAQTFGRRYLKKIYPIYEGINRELLGAKENTALGRRFKQPFFLYVGNFYPHKNVERLILAFSSIKSGAQLVLVGPDDFFADRTRELINKLNQERKIILFYNPKIEDFVFFYKNALALVHPSLAEGFGLPLVEAMHFGLPIIASDIQVFKEVLGDQYLSFDPRNVNDLKNKIDEFLKKHPGFDYKGLLPKYSFEEMTKKTLGVYNKAIYGR